MKNKILDISNKIFISLFFPSFVTGLFLPNVICGVFVLYNLIFNFRKLNRLIYKYFIPSIFFIIFYLIIILSSFLSNYKLHSFESSALYFVCILYTLSLIILFDGDKKTRKLFFIFGITTCAILSLDAIYEIINGSNILGYSSISGRIAGLFGTRWLLGRYLVYVLPILVGIYFLEKEYLKKYQLYIFCIFCLIGFTIIFSGERAAFIMLFIYLFFILIFLINKISFSKILIILFVIILLFLFPFFISETSERIQHNFIIYLTSTDYEINQYLSMYLSSWKMFIENPLIGVGPNNFRFECAEPYYNVSKWSCSTHPHSITFQLLAEIGLFGFLCVFSVLSYFIYKSALLVKLNEYSEKTFGIYSIQCSIIIYLFPFMITGNFFLSWYSFIFYLPISLFMVYSNKLK